MYGIEWRCSRAILPLDKETERSLMSSVKRPKEAVARVVLVGLVQEAEDLGRVAIPIEGMALSVGGHEDVDGVGGVVVGRRHPVAGR